VYRRQNSSVLIGFIDASKAFDRVNHRKLFLKMKLRGVSDSLIRILAYWYANQSIQVRSDGVIEPLLRLGLVTEYDKGGYSPQPFLTCI